MNLTDGLQEYKKDAQFWQFTLELEKNAQQIKFYLLQHRHQPTPTALEGVKIFLISVEKWKAMCLRDRMGNAEKNSKESIWNALYGAIDAQDDFEAILSVMQLRGFGSSVDEETGQRRAKVATSVLRFLNPEEWGVVDWRTIAMLAQLEQCEGNVDRAIKRAKGFKANELRIWFDTVDEVTAVDRNQKYREMRSEYPITRAADIDMALFGLSLIAWPI